jgi:hypothetical protein
MSTQISSHSQRLSPIPRRWQCPATWYSWLRVVVGVIACCCLNIIIQEDIKAKYISNSTAELEITDIFSCRPISRHLQPILIVYLRSFTIFVFQLILICKRANFNKLLTLSLVWLTPSIKFSNIDRGDKILQFGT